MDTFEAGALSYLGQTMLLPVTQDPDSFDQPLLSIDTYNHYPTYDQDAYPR